MLSGWPPTRPSSFASAAFRSRPSDWRSCGRSSGQPHITADAVADDRQGRDRRHLAPVGLRRPRRAGRRRPHPAHSARRVTGALRGSGRRQPPPSDLSNLRPGGRRRLRGRLRAVSHGGRRQGLRDRRGRGRLLGALSGLPGAVPRTLNRRSDAAGHPVPTHQHPDAEANDASEESRADRAAHSSHVEVNVNMNNEQKCPFSGNAHQRPVEPRLVAESVEPERPPHATTPRAIRWARRSTTPRSSRPSISLP